MPQPERFIVRATGGERQMVQAIADTLDLSVNAVWRLALRRLYRQMCSEPLPPPDLMQDLAVQAMERPKKEKKGGK